MRIFLTTTFVLTFVCMPALGEDAARKPASDEADLPKVLLIGDSISIGYTSHVQEMLKGKAAVSRIKGNAQHTGTGLRKIDRWLGETKWDVIHFNWGLWDLCYRHPESKVQGKRDKVNGAITTPLAQYEENLEVLVTRLKKTNARLIWAHTSFVPEMEAGRKVGDDVKYNQAAARVMKKHGIQINDLHALTKTFPADLFTKPGDVHYKPDGYKKLGRQVADTIAAALHGDRDESNKTPTKTPTNTPPVKH